MTLSGKQLINGSWTASTHQSGIEARNPVDNSTLPTQFVDATLEDVALAVDAASQAFTLYSALSDATRATFLDEIALELEGAADTIISRCMLETALPEQRLRGELGRTTGQLRQFSTLLRSADWRRTTFDQAMPERAPVPKPDLRLTQIALGPVVVFSASNFPLAFSTAGGDTASALAAGCPVIVKAHSAHPGTSELVAQCIARAITTCHMPAGTFGHLHGSGKIIGAALVQHPQIKAGGFTGSVAGGRALFDLANQRPHPIPFFGELGSTNPVFLLPNAVAQKTTSIAETFVAAMTLGAGQFCTSPGILVIKSDGNEKVFLEQTARQITLQQPQTMLTQAICSSFNQSNDNRQNIPGVNIVATGQAASNNNAQAMVMSVAAADYLAQPDLQEEIFGPSALAIVCCDDEEMMRVAESFHGHLTGSVFAEDGDLPLAKRLYSVLQNKVGRLIYNGYGTGVEVCASMSHGGPYPSSTNVQSTSVGTRAIDRFVRPLCFQNTPQALLPDELKD